MAKKKRRIGSIPKIVITATDLSKKVETRFNSARLASTKSKPYKGSKYATEKPVKRITYKTGDTLTKKEISVAGAKFTRFDSTSPKKKK